MTDLAFKNKRNFLFKVALISILGIVCIVGCKKEDKKESNLKLWYRQPAKEWTDALPIGNGRLGVMVYGGVKKDHIQFNEETLWTGDPRDYNRSDAANYLPKIRKMLFKGKQEEAEALAQQHFMGKKNNEESYDSLFTQWLKTIRTTENLLPIAPDFNDSNWKKMSIPTPDGFERSVSGLKGEDGAFWFRKSFDLPEQWSGKQLVLALGNIRDMDFTYLNGHFIGSLKGKGKVREYIIPARYLNKKNNIIAIQVINPDNKGGLAGYHFGNHGKMTVYPKGKDAQNGINLETEWKYKVQNNTPPNFPHYQASYQPFGDLWLNFPDVDSAKEYKRTLDIENAMSTTTFVDHDVRYTREYFASAPACAIVIHLSSDHKEAIHFVASLTSKHHLSQVKRIDDHTIGLNLKVKKGVLQGASRLLVKTEGGKVVVDSGKINVDAANSATLYLVAGTSFKNYKDVSGNPEKICIQDMKKAVALDYEKLKAQHIQEYQKYFNRFSVDFGRTAASDDPTDERIKRFDTQADPALVALYMQYARYLMISSSRPGTHPPNLQGIWNNKMRPPWGSKYTTNINLEMNYWPVEVLNLSDCFEPLSAMMMNLAKNGRETAKDYYDCPGWILHHNTDIWLGTAPIDNANHGIWPTGGAWLCHQLWNHFLFTQDTTFLRDTAYPVMQSAAQFFNCYLIKDPKTGYLISSPSNSPEHGGLVAGPTMDHQIIRDLFKNCIAAAKILGEEGDLTDTLKRKYQEIAPNQIGRYGQLQEWMQDVDDTADHYRHVSHLWGVFPGEDIIWKDTALMEAAEQSLIYRGDEGTGWSLAWKINLWDRFKKGNHAYHLLQEMLSPSEMPGRESRGGSYNNLFDAHPPFQIDGNFGGATGIANMLVQSETGTIELLPALPDSLPFGKVTGLQARGGIVLDILWKKGRLKKVDLKTKVNRSYTLKYNGKEINIQAKKGKSYHLDGNLEEL